MINLKKTMGLALITLTIGATSVAALEFPMHRTSIESVAENFRKTSSGITTEEDDMIYDNSRNQSTCHGLSESEMHNGMNYNYNSSSENTGYNSNNNSNNSYKGMKL